MCQVIITTAPYLNRELTMSGTGSLRVTIPSPISTAISIAPTTVYAGLNAELTCTVIYVTSFDGITADIVLTGPTGQLTHNNSRITVNNVQVLGPIFRRTYQFRPISGVDSGDYTCTATVRPATVNNLVTNTVQTGMMTIPVVAPTLDVSVPDLTTRVLDISTYNTFTLTCTATSHVSGFNTALTKTIQWFRSIGSGQQEMITDSTNGVDITTNNLEAAASSSELRMTVNTAGDHTFVCRATLDLSPATDVIHNSDSTTITVNGQTRPNAPTGLTTDNLRWDRVTICWTVESISYNPESYVVEYGTSESNLNINSARVESGSDIARMGFQLEVMITGLQPNTLYYYRVVATNRVGSTTSVIRSITTEEDVLLFQVRLAGIANCLEWVEINSHSKIEDITNVITNYINQRCSCSFASSQITNGALRCFPESPQAVTFRGTLNGRSGAYTDDTISYIEQLTATESTITVQSVLRTIDDSCVVVINSYNDVECQPRTNDSTTAPLATTFASTTLSELTTASAVIMHSTTTSSVISTDAEPTSQSDNVLGPIVGGVVAVVLILAITIAIVIIAVTILVLRDRRAVGKLHKTDIKNDELPPVGLSSLPNPVTSCQTYEQVELGPEYEDLNKYSEAYAELKPPEKQQMAGDYEFTQCAAYGTPATLAKGTSAATRVPGNEEKMKEEDMHNDNPGMYEEV